MRKLSLLISSCIAVVALAAFSAPAFGITRVDDSCDLNNPEWGDGVAGPYNNDPVVHEFNLDFDSPFAHAVSGYTGSGIACGTQISSDLVGTGTLNDNARVVQAPNETTNSTDPADGIPLTSYVGDGEINAASHGITDRPLIIAQPFTLRTDALSECERENGLLRGGPELGEVVACYKGTATGEIQGHNWNFVVEEGERDVTVIGPFYNDTLPEHLAGLTSINAYTLCDYAGDTGAHGSGGSCGSPSSTKWVRKNGDWSATLLGSPPVPDRYPSGRHDCYDGYGRITVTATNKDAVTTPRAGICAAWYQQPRAVPHP